MLLSGAGPGISVSKVDPCGVCGKRVMSNSVLCTSCEKWIHGRCANVERVTEALARDFVCGRCQNRIEEVVEPAEELCEEVETVKEFCYLGDEVIADGGCEAAVTARARFGWVKFKECGEQLRRRRFPLKVKRESVSELREDLQCCMGVRHGA